MGSNQHEGQNIGMGQVHFHDNVKFRMPAPKEINTITGVAVQHEHGTDYLHVTFLAQQYESKTMKLSLDVARQLRTALGTMKVLEDDGK